MGRVKHDDLVAGVTGLEVHGKKLRITFTYKRARCREVLDLPITKANVKFATNKLATIKHEIAIGTFSYAHHFPDSPALARFGGSRRNITIWEAYQDFWRLHKPMLKPTSRHGYPFAIEACIKILGRDRQVSTLMPKDIELIRNELHISLKPNSIVTYLGRFRQLLRWCEKNGLLEDAAKLTGGVRPITARKTSPADPFEFEEYTRLLEACSHNQQRNMITLAIYTGLRTGELRALAWEDIDLNKGVMLISRNISNESDYFKLPKTNEPREVDLQPPVIAALKSQMALSFMRAAVLVDVDMNGHIERQSIRPVFTPKVTGPHVPHAKEFFTAAGVSHAWSNIMRRAGVRYRRFYQLRHTFASWNLTSHGNLAYIAAQMGHADLEMLQSVYGKWIASASKSEAVRIWEQMQSKGLFAPMTPQEKKIQE